MTDKLTQSDYRAYKTPGGGKGFVDFNNLAALEQLREKSHNTDIRISAKSYASCDVAAECKYPLYLVIANPLIQEARKSAIEGVYQITEQTGICPDEMDIYYNGAGSESYDKIPAKSVRPAEFCIYIHPATFGTISTHNIPLVGFNLARQMIKNQTRNILIDVYERDHFITLPNSAISSHGSHNIPLQLKELVNIDAHSLAELAKKPLCENSYAITIDNTKAQAWLKQRNEEINNFNQKQQFLLTAMNESGWQKPACIRKLQTSNLQNSAELEACRVVAAYLAWIKAAPGEIWSKIQSMCYANSVHGQTTLKAIVSFAIENRRFVGCQHPLLQKFCLGDKCFIRDLISECEKPHFQFYNNGNKNRDMKGDLI